jgi:hypothetical protein
MIRNMKRNIASILALSMVASQSISAFAVDPDEILILDEDRISEISEEEIVVESDLESGDIQDVGEADESLEADGIEISDEMTDAEYDVVLSADEASPEAFEYSSMSKEFQQNVIAMADVSEFEKLVEGVDYMPNEVVAIADSEEEAQKIAAAYGGYLKSYSYGVAVIGLEESSYTVAKAYCAGLDQELQLPEVEPNYITYLTDPVETSEVYIEADNSNSAFSPGDIWEFIHYNYEFDDPALNPNNFNGYGYQWFHEMIGSYSAWLVSTGKPSVVVAVIDTGVYDAHEDLSGKVIVPTDFNLGYGLANNQDMVGHGTHVAGIIAAKIGNGVGGAGVAPDATILALNDSYPYENPSTGKISYVFLSADEAKAINYVAGEGTSARRADIINMSIGGVMGTGQVKTAVDFAYGRGVTICASMGNESANNVSYPAAYDHVIGVAAVNQAGEKSNFSTFGKNCDISAPGSDIFSTVTGSTSSYDSWDGTSMASPVVAGACALYMSVYGYQKPDDMEKILKSNAKKVSGSGMGAGIVSLENMFGKTVPVPTISLKDKDGKDLGSASNNKAVTLKGTIPADAYLTFSADNKAGKDKTYIVYTTDGTVPTVSNYYAVNGNVLSYNYWNDGKLPVKEIVGNVDTSTTITVKAIALSYSGAVSKVTSLKFTVDKTASTTTISSVTITGQNSVVAGGSATYKATVLPAKAKNKTVEWAVDDTSKALGIAISNKGKLTVPATVKAGTEIVVSAVSADKAATGKYYVEVTDSKVNSVRIKLYGDQKPIKSAIKKNSLSSVTLYNADIDGTNFATDERVIILKAEFLDKAGKSVSADGAVWTSSNEKVVQVFYVGGVVYVRACSKGTANITCAASDGSGKKASVKINVVVPASGISVTANNSQSSWISLGKSASMKAIVGANYGAPSNKKVKWSCKVGIFSVDSQGYLSENMEYLPEAAQNDIVKNIKAFTVSNGKVKVGDVKKYVQAQNNYMPTSGTYVFGFEVIATTTDGTNYSDSKTFRINPGVAKDLWIGNAKTKHSALTYDDSMIGSQWYWSIYTTGYPTFEVTSSNSDVVSAYTSGSRLYLTFHQKGSVKIKIRALDGSNKTITVPVKYTASSGK